MAVGMQRGGGRKCSISNESYSSYKKIDQRKLNDSSLCKANPEHHVTNVSLRREELKQEFAKKLIKRRVVNLWSDDSRDLTDDGKPEYHHDDLYCNQLNKVWLAWQQA